MKGLTDVHLATAILAGLDPGYNVIKETHLVKHFGDPVSAGLQDFITTLRSHAKPAGKPRTTAGLTPTPGPGTRSSGLSCWVCGKHHIWFNCSVQNAPIAKHEAVMKEMLENGKIKSDARVLAKLKQLGSTA